MTTALSTPRPKAATPRKPRPRRTTRLTILPELLVIFLDMDGVLAVSDPVWTGLQRICRPAVQILNSIIERTGAKVVISSTWRYDPKENVGWTVDEFNSVLAKAGFKGEVIGITPHLPGLDVRGLEIQAWLDEQQVKPTRFAILDDCEPMRHLTHRTVMTDYDRALTPGDAEEVVLLLKEKT